MKKDSIDRNRLVYSELFKKEVEPFVLVDAGARGGLEEPWSWIDPSLVSAIGFDPDKDECARLSKTYPHRRYFPTALWSGDAQIPIYSTEDPSCSSAYRPNINFIQRYEDKHWKSKVTKNIATYPARSLDAVVAESGIAPDFLKLDVHGSEYEILMGAEQTLSKSIFGVLAETWTTEVYEGQPTSGKILEFMRAKGFELFGVNVAAAWKHKTAPVLARGKRQIIGLDLLFFKDSRDRKFFNSVRTTLKCAALAELYGYPDYAVELIDLRLQEEPSATLTAAREIIVANASIADGIFKRGMRKLRRIVFDERVVEYPSLHP